MAEPLPCRTQFLLTTVILVYINNFQPVFPAPYSTLNENPASTYTVIRDGPQLSADYCDDSNCPNYSKIWALVGRHEKSLTEMTVNSSLFDRESNEVQAIKLETKDYASYFWSSITVAIPRDSNGNPRRIHVNIYVIPEAVILRGNADLPLPLSQHYITFGGNCTNDRVGEGPVDMLTLSISVVTHELIVEFISLKEEDLETKLDSRSFSYQWNPFPMYHCISETAKQGTLEKTSFVSPILTTAENDRIRLTSPNINADKGLMAAIIAIVFFVCLLFFFLQLLSFRAYRNHLRQCSGCSSCNSYVTYAFNAINRQFAAYQTSLSEDTEQDFERLSN